jgi:predicted phage-related endonuclease
MIRPEMDGSDSAKELLDSLYRGGIVEQIVMPEEAIEYVDAYIEASEEEEAARAKKQEASNRIKELMGDYEKAKCIGHTISWKSVSSERLDTKLLKEQEPEIYAKYVKTSKSRRFTVK